LTIKRALINLGKLILCGLAYALGTAIGGALAVLLKLPAPTPLPGVDTQLAGLYLMLATPLLALALAVVTPGLAGGFVARTLVLSFFLWVASSVNTQLEATIVSSYATGFWFSVVSSLVASLFCGATTALLFPTTHKGQGLFAAGKAFFARREVAAWAWRLPLAAVAFMPIYYVFGLMVLPFTGEYYRQSMFGLVMPTLDQLLPILFVRSVLFLAACLPVLVLWEKPERSLFWRLGLALFLLVGLVYMLISTWLPLKVRVPHTLEMLADEFVYAWVLTVLLSKREGSMLKRRPRSSVRVGDAQGSYR
jgi:hypothetical protein